MSNSCIIRFLDNASVLAHAQRVASTDWKKDGRYTFEQFRFPNILPATCDLMD